MPQPEDSLPIHPPQVREQGTTLALLPVAATVLFYCSPESLQQHRLYQFLPQFCAYAAFAAWLALNTSCIQRLGLQSKLMLQGFRWGSVTGFLLGLVNTGIILYLVPRLGGEYRFLADTPHARIPLAIMLPWFIGCIAVMVEVNFRGFLLGRFLSLGLSPSTAIGASALLFAFDPFLVATFQQLHWIAVWDGLIWGTLWVVFRNLYITIVAHAMEVIVLYVAMRMVLA